MDRVLSPNDTQSIYEIYRACRLCGAGAGYKMPIIQNVISLDDQDIQLKQKIRECVQIEVHQDDKMPPLICELCVDKVNDYYEFLNMCRQTNKRTRLRLGLPLASSPKGSPDTSDCILGVTEPVYINSDSECEPLSKQMRTQPKQIRTQPKQIRTQPKQIRTQPKHQSKSKVKKKTELHIKLEKRSDDNESRSTRSTRRERTPPRITRNSKSPRDNKSDDQDNIALSKLRINNSKPNKFVPKSILKKEVKSENSSLVMNRLKRPHEKDSVKTDIPHKKVKIMLKSPPIPTRRSRDPPKLNKPSKPILQLPRAAKAAKPPPKPHTPSPPPRFQCIVCKVVIKTSQALGNHVKSHTVGFTNLKLACNACGVWFPTSEEALCHHNEHTIKDQPYTCRRCFSEFQDRQAYDEHMDDSECTLWGVVPDVKCDVCWHEFPTNRLLEDHKCQGKTYRPGGKCLNCDKSFSLLKNLKRHESICKPKIKDKLIVDPEVMGRLKPIQVRVARCDPLLRDVKQGPYDVSAITSNFGLDRNCVYPYKSSVSSHGVRTKSGKLNSLVYIKQDINDKFSTKSNYIQWDRDSETKSEHEVTDEGENAFAKKNRIDSLLSLCLKTILSHNFIGKVPKMLKKIQFKLAFDSLLRNDENVREEIRNIIQSLSNGDDSDSDNTVDGMDDNELIEGSNDDNIDTSNNDHKDVSMDVVSNDLSKEDNNDFIKDNANETNTNVSIGDRTKNETDDLIKEVCDDLSKIYNNTTIVDTVDNQNTESGKEIIKDDNNSNKNNDLSKDSANVLSKDNADDFNEDQDNDLNKGDSNDLNKDAPMDVCNELIVENNNVLKEESNELLVDKLESNDKFSSKEKSCFNKANDIDNLKDSAINMLTDITDTSNDNIISDFSLDVTNLFVTKKDQSAESGSSEKNGDDVIKNKNDFCNDKLSDAQGSVNCNSNVNEINRLSKAISSEDKPIEKGIRDKLTPINNIFTHNEEKSLYNEHTNENCEINYTELNGKNNYTDNKTTQFDGESRNINLDTNENDRKLFNVEENNSEEDDRRLMEELDAQIADNGGNIESNDKNDKMCLDDLMATRHDEHSLGLDSISDEDFNFDN